MLSRPLRAICDEYAEKNGVSVNCCKVSIKNIFQIAMRANNFSGGIAKLVWVDDATDKNITTVLDEMKAELEEII